MEPFIPMVTFFFILLIEAFIVAAIALSSALAFFMDKKALKRMLAILLVASAVLAASYAVFRAQEEGYGFYQKDCQADTQKNKVAVVIAKGGIYDTEEMSAQVSAYYAAVKKDLNIESAGLKRFEGTRMDSLDELDKFVDGLYSNDDVAYIILVGDDLPIGNVTNETTYELFMKGLSVPIPLYDIPNKLECANRNCEVKAPLYTLEEEKCEYNCKMLRLCSDMGVSVILPPIFYSDNEKADFVLKVLEKYTYYHENFASLSSEYQKSLLLVQDVLEEKPKYKFSGDAGYSMPMTVVFNNETKLVEEELKEKHMALLLSVHGTRGTVGLGLISPGEYFGYTTLERYLSFTDENGLPALFVESDACEWDILKHREDFQHCCWPQIFMESGVWAYYTGSVLEVESYGKANIPNFEQPYTWLAWRKTISDEQTIGMAVRKNSDTSTIIFGDILAHMK